MRVLVSGGAGYIGSHTVVQLVAAGHDVVVVDSFANAKPTVVGRVEALTGRAPRQVTEFLRRHVEPALGRVPRRKELDALEV